MSSQNNTEKTSKGSIDALQWLWRLFSSVKLAVILILVLTGIGLIGALVTGDGVFHSWWFYLPVILLMLNILVCSLNRWKGIIQSVHGGTVKQPEGFYTVGNTATSLGPLTVPAATAAAIPEKILRRQGYRVRIESSDGCYYLAADKNRYFRPGTYASHLSLILFVLAYIIGSSLGFRDNAFIVVEGQTADIGYNTGLSLHLVSFVDEYYADNTPKDYRSQVVLYDQGSEVRQSLVRVNHPLQYHGVRIYQSFFGPAAGITIRQNGKIIYQGNIALDATSDNQGYRRYYGTLDLADVDLAVHFIGSSVNMDDPVIPVEQLAVDLRQDGEQIGLDLLSQNVPLVISGFEFTYTGNANFSGFQVSRDPGNMLIWIASALFIIGMVLVLYFPYRQVRVLVQLLPLPGECRLLLRLIPPRGFNGTAEFKKLTGDIEKELTKSHKSDLKNQNCS